MRIGILTFLLAALVATANTHAAPQAPQEQISTWLQEGAWQEVLSAVSAAENKTPFLLNAGGYAAYQSGDYPAASQYYTQLLAADSNHRSGHYYSAMLAMNEKAWTLAIPHLQRLTIIAPGVAQYHTLLGDCFYAHNDLEDAARSYRQALTLASTSPVIANKLARTQLARKQYEEALSTLLLGRMHHPRDPALLATSIRLEYLEKRFLFAARLTDSLIATGDLRYDALLTGMYANMERKEYGRAVEIGELLLFAGNETEEVLYYMAMSEQARGSWAQADTLLQRCLAKTRKPAIENYYFALAEGAARQGQLARSGASYDTAYYLFHNSAALYNKGLQLERANKPKEAVAVYKQYLALPPAKQDSKVAAYLTRYIAAQKKGN